MWPGGLPGVGVGGFGAWATPPVRRSSSAVAVPADRPATSSTAGIMRERVGMVLSATCEPVENLRTAVFPAVRVAGAGYICSSSISRSSIAADLMSS
jgi:hypothetical protein